MVDVARYFSDFNRQESCGKCTTCRIGTKRMLELLEKITSGRGEEDDLIRLDSIAKLIKNATLFGFGRSAPNPVLSTIQNFRPAYESRMAKKKPDDVFLASFDIQAALSSAKELIGRGSSVFQ